MLAHHRVVVESLTPVETELLQASKRSPNLSIYALAERLLLLKQHMHPKSNMAYRAGSHRGDARRTLKGVYFAQLELALDP